MPEYTLIYHRGDEAEVHAKASSLRELEEKVRSGAIEPGEYDWGNSCLFYVDVFDEKGDEVTTFEMNITGLD